jgi:chaperone BCS1
MTNNIVSEVTHSVVNLTIPLLEQTIPFFKDSRAVIATSSLLHIFVSGISCKLGPIFNFNRYNSVEIKQTDKNYKRIIQYIIENYPSYLHNISITNQKKKIKSLKKAIPINFNNNKIYINIEKSEQNNDKKYYFDSNEDYDDYDNNIITFSSKISAIEIKKCIDNIIEKADVVGQNTITLYYIKKIEKEKGKSTYGWEDISIRTNKEMKYVFVSNDVKDNFLGKINTFIKDDQYYKKRGLPYKVSFLLHGPPGCGKTSIIRAICNEYQLPVFIMNMNDLSNHDVNSLLMDMRKIVRNSEKYVVLLEDFDRVLEKIKSKSYNSRFNNYNHNDYDYNSNLANSSKEISMDCILNFLDGIDESYGRITIITANDITDIICNEALCRPGRIDHDVKLDNCDNEQIRQILEMYNINISEYEISLITKANISPAKLINLLNKYNCKETLLENIHELLQDNEEIEEEKEIINVGGKRKRDEPSNNLSNYKSTNSIEKKINMNLSKRRRLEKTTTNMDKKINSLNKSEERLDNIEKQILVLQKEKIKLEVVDINKKIDELKEMRKICIESEIKSLQEQKSRLE